ncbi:uncharacterized protein (DUF983 family) [Actinoplanes octamycinicus]|uniref:Uncharacterized protein (DUF983 family) n=1 Tax=Actinoplanes octamycinicus TaxID=135948 RepID=A0A7W7GXG3_9ACTN|nr:hypothetical protein [Actinoplanes octamycinicus]MBB4740120.1 uncharacterized protein (DUF983 family) [Actinoplanes octamycinicus]GIE59517.1 hypothetical protein Aoc01nite_49190 [Actinoplanes octamycinicus]
MSNSSYASERPTGADAPAAPATGWAGMVVFAGVLLLTLGVFQLTEGLVALYEDHFYLVSSDALVLQMSYTTWGWVHVGLGLLSLVAAGGVFLGRIWGRAIGILIAFLGALLHFMFIAAQPVWASILIGMDVLIIYTLAAHGGAVRKQH